MTTNIHILSTTNVLSDNEVMNLKKLHLEEASPLAGMSWTTDVTSSKYDALLSVYKYLYHLIFERIPNYKMWLIVGDYFWQDNNRIVNHRKIWKSLALRNIKITHNSCSQEVMHELDGKIKFFGMTQLSELSIPSATKASLDENCSYIALLPGAVEPKEILNIGWSGKLSSDGKIVSWALRNKGLIFKRIGDFDDRDIGFVAVGEQELLNTIKN